MGHFPTTPVRIRAVRLAFFALLFLNLAYFAWAHWIDAPAPARVNPGIAHLPQLRLVEEVPPAERPRPHTAQKTALSQDSSCLSMGPFADPVSSAQAAAVLHTSGFEPRERTEPAQPSPSYWVYVGNLSQSEADGALVALERSGVNDARVMPDNGEAKRRVSLGIYSERARAERRADLVRRSGLEPEIVERRLAGALYWIDVTPEREGARVPPPELLLPRSNARIVVQPCPSAPAPPPAAGRYNLRPARGGGGEFLSAGLAQW